MANKCRGCRYANWAIQPDVCFYCQGDVDIAEDKFEASSPEFSYESIEQKIVALLKVSCINAALRSAGLQTRASVDEDGDIIFKGKYSEVPYVSDVATRTSREYDKAREAFDDAAFDRAWDEAYGVQPQPEKSNPVRDAIFRPFGSIAKPVLKSSERVENSKLKPLVGCACKLCQARPGYQGGMP